MARNAVGMTLACEEYGAAFFANGARPGGVLKHPGVLKDPSKLRESWQAVYGGTANTGKVVVLEEGVDYQQISIPPEEAQQFIDALPIGKLHGVGAVSAEKLKRMNVKCGKDLRMLSRDQSARARKFSVPDLLQWIPISFGFADFITQVLFTGFAPASTSRSESNISRNQVTKIN